MSMPETTRRSSRAPLGLIALLVVMIIVFVVLARDANKDPRSYDNKDPKKTHCERDAKTIGVPFDVMLPDDIKFGELQFRTSRYCGTVWGTVFTIGPRPAGYERVVITSVRPKDGKRTSFQTKDYDTNPNDGRIWGYMLGSSPKIGCVEITVQVFQYGRPGPVTKIGCLTA